MLFFHPYIEIFLREIKTFREKHKIIDVPFLLPNSNLGGKMTNHKNNKRHTVPAYFVVDFPRNNYAVLAIAKIEHSLYEIQFP